VSLPPRTVSFALALALLAAAPAAAEPPDPAPLTLRLPDLGPGYVMHDTGSSTADNACTALRLSARGLSPTVHRVGRFPNRSCWMSFARAWTPPDTLPGPDFVDSIGFAFDDPQGAQALLAHPRAIPAVLLNVAPRQLRVAEQTPEIGEEAVLLRFGGRSSLLSVVVVVWRTGSTVGMIGVTEIRSAGTGDQAALRLAAVQQARTTAPTPLLASDFDDLEVPLDDPRIAGPVYWLGREVPASGRFPRLPLAEVEPPTHADAQDRLRAALHYGRDIDYGTSISVLTIDPGLLRKPGPRRELRRIRRAHCTIVDRLRLPTGRATIFTGAARCPHYGDTFALVRLPGALVTITPDGCQICHGPVSRYGTRVGLKTLVRALRLRQPPA